MFDVKNALASLCISGGLQHGLPKSHLGCCEALATQVDQACFVGAAQHIGNVSSASAFKPTASACGLLDVIHNCPLLCTGFNHILVWDL